MIDQKIKKDRFLKIAVFILLTLVTLGIEWFYFGFNNVTLDSPLCYRVDGMTTLMNIKKAITDSASVQTGWPYVSQTADYSAHYKLISDLWIQFCSLFSDSAVVISNLKYIAIPVLNVMCAYVALQEFGIRRWISYLCALAFGFCPYVQNRLTPHSALAAVECIPVAILICVWLVEDESFNRLGKGWVHHKRNWITLALAWCIANNGMIYYPFFTCFLLCLTALYLWIRTRDWKKILAPLFTVAEIVFWLALDFIPVVVGLLKGAEVSVDKGAERGAYQSLYYGLQISSLFTDPNGYGSEAIRDKFNQLSDYNNEKCFAYMGLLAIIGFCILLLSLMRREKENATELEKRVHYLSHMNVGILLLAVTGGFGCLVATIVPFIRCYNRISPYIVFISILTAGLLLEKWLQKERTIKRKRILSGAMAVVMVLCIIQQQGTYGYIGGVNAREYREEQKSDELFVSQIEELTGKDSLVFQLPYMKSFENGSVNQVPDYDHYRLVLNSSEIRTSFGATAGSENDIWYYETSQLDPEAMVEELRHQGFDGIYINTDGYTAMDGFDLAEQLMEAANCSTPLVNGSVLYIPIDLEEQTTESLVIEDDNLGFDCLDGYYLYESEPVTLSSGANYRVTIQLEPGIDVSVYSQFFVDFYAGGYDWDEQECDNFLVSGRDSYTLYMSAGYLEDGTMQAEVRIAVFCDQAEDIPIPVTSIVVEEIR